MFKRSVHIRCWGSLLLCMPLWGQAETAPSAEFWQYLLEFSDEQGEFIDPEDFIATEDLVVIDQLKTAGAKTVAETTQQSSSIMNINNQQKGAN